MTGTIGTQKTPLTLREIGTKSSVPVKMVLCIEILVKPKQVHARNDKGVYAFQALVWPLLITAET